LRSWVALPPVDGELRRVCRARLAPSSTSLSSFFSSKFLLSRTLNTFIADITLVNLEALVFSPGLFEVPYRPRFRFFKAPLEHSRQRSPNAFFLIFRLKSSYNLLIFAHIYIYYKRKDKSQEFLIAIGNSEADALMKWTVPLPFFRHQFIPPLSV